MNTRSRHSTAHPGAGAPGTVKLWRRASWGIADQVLNSASNFAMGIVVARAVPLADFGAYALAFAGYSLALGISRSLSTEPYAVRYSAVDDERARDAAGRSTGTALLIGSGLGALLAAAAPLLDAGTRPLALALAVSLPGLMLQDAWRQVFFSAARGSGAFLNDLLWLLFMIPGFAWLMLSSSHSVAAYVLAWGLAGTAAAVCGLLQARLWPRPAKMPAWAREHRGLWTRYLGENLAVNGAQQVLFAAIAAVAGMAALGQLKLAMVALGPVFVLVQGVGVVAVPEAARALRSGPRSVNRVRHGSSGLVAGGAAVWGLVLLLLPLGWTTALLGPQWPAAAVLVLPLVLVQVGNGLRTGDAVMLRAMGQAHRGFVTRALTSGLSALAGLLGALLAAADGAAWAMAVAAALSAWLWAVQYRRGCAEAAHTRLPGAVLMGKGA
ncbi:O-antigen/teichoic acid export membrane protein [Arthrobacter woluwensis]|nr:O-antigen/teichoic acid export membrane protein [Arthrobacter woluwensis]